MAKMGIVWDQTTAFVGERVGPLALVALAAFVVPTVISTCLQAFAATSSPGARLAILALILLLSVASMLGSLIVMAMAIGGGDRASAVPLAARRLPAALLVSIALGLAAALCFAPVPLILLARGYDVMAIAAGQGGNVVVDPQTSSMVALYVLVLIPVLLFALTRLILVSPVVVREAVSFGAVRRSWALTRRHGWRIFGVLVLFALIGGIAQLAARTVFGSVFALLFGAEQGLTLAMVLTTVVTACVQAIIMVLLAAFQGKLYTALAADPAWPA